MTALRALAGLLCVLLLAPAAADAVTIDQIVELSKQGVSDAVIVALIERDRSVFALEPDQLAELQREGVSEIVTVAMLKTGSTPEPAVDAPPVQPGVVVYVVPAPSHRPHGSVVPPPAVPATPAPASARGIFFTTPSTGIFFPPPSSGPHRQ